MRQWTEQDLIDLRENFPLEHCLRAPEFSVSPALTGDFERLYSTALQRGPSVPIEYMLDAAKFVFLDWAADRYGLVLHGSTNKGLEVLETIRLTRDARSFGDQAAIYATQASLWAMFYAVLDRKRYAGHISTGAIHIEEEGGEISRFYFFLLEADGLAARPWTDGSIYLLPKEDFEADPAMSGGVLGGRPVVCTHWLRRAPVRPVARLPVSPADFPFLNRLWGYDPELYERRMSAASIAGYPFLDDPEIYPIRPQASGHAA